MSPIWRAPMHPSITTRSWCFNILRCITWQRGPWVQMTGDLLMAGRSVSVFSAALLCILAGWIMFQALPHRADWQIRLFAAAFAGALPTALYNFNWTWLARVDTLAILLSFSGVAVFAARPTSPTLQILAAVLMTAGLFTRQTALAAPLACLLVAFVIDRKISLRLLLTMAILGGVVLGWLAWRTHGQVLLHLFRYNQTAFSIPRAVFGLLMNTRHVAGLLVLAGGASLGVLRGSWALVRGRRWDLLGANLRSNGRRRTVFLLAAYSMLAALSALTFGKEGSDINYFLEWNLSLVPLAGILLFRAAPPAGNRVRLHPVWLVALAYPCYSSIPASIEPVTAGSASSMGRWPPIGKRWTSTGRCLQRSETHPARYSPRT